MKTHTYTHTHTHTHTLTLTLTSSLPFLSLPLSHSHTCTHSLSRLEKKMGSLAPLCCSHERWCKDCVFEQAAALYFFVLNQRKRCVDVRCTQCSYQMLPLLSEETGVECNWFVNTLFMLCWFEGECTEEWAFRQKIKTNRRTKKSQIPLMENTFLTRRFKSTLFWELDLPSEGKFASGFFFCVGVETIPLFSSPP